MFSFKQIDIKDLPISKILLIIMTIVAIVAIRSCQMREIEVTSSGIKIQMYQSQAKVYGVKVNKMGEVIATQLAVITNKDKEVQRLLTKNSTLNNVNTQMRFSAVTKVSDIQVPYTDPVELAIDTTVQGEECVELGTKFSTSDKWYSVAGSVEKNGINIDSISMKDSLTYNLGTKRKPGLVGFFKPYDPTVEVISSNPHIQVKSLQNMTFVRQPQWFENRGVWLLAGVIAGSVTAVYITK